ncbi:BRCT domain-containing protein [Pseudomonas syringae]|uniref:BRCT domain-containing protein n=1 Tax=Pseudomonas syringae TaxID=317 RepID=UPI00061B42DA|nr:BRCT domain-containing protein [Pseudomonas syringae]
MVDLHQEFQNSRFFNQARIDRRSVDALIGISAGLCADGSINQAEAVFLKEWVEGNLTHLDDPVVNLLYRRLNNMLSDGVLDAEESIELFSLLKQFSGGQSLSSGGFSIPGTLPLNNPAPVLDWNDRLFMFTGTMAYGPRKHCEELVLERGGQICSGLTKKTSFLIVGSLGNDQWLHSSYGLKIKKAVELREAGVPIAIVSEGHWQQAVFG